MYRKLIAASLAALTIILSIPMTASAESQFDNLFYEITKNDTIMILGGNGDLANVNIPSEINNRAVTNIAPNAFKGEDIVNLTISDKIHIGQMAFANCPELENVNIGSGCVFENKTFYNCDKLTEFTGTDMLCATPDTAEILADCDALITAKIEISTDSEIPDMNNWFKGCDSLNTVKFYNNHEEPMIIKNGVFADCPKLRTIQITDNKKNNDNIKLYLCADGITGCDNLEFINDFSTSEHKVYMPGKDLETIPDIVDETWIIAGDVDNDRAISASDALHALRASVGIEVFEKGGKEYVAAKTLDPNGISKDEGVLSSDALTILRFSAGY